MTQHQHPHTQHHQPDLPHVPSPPVHAKSPMPIIARQCPVCFLFFGWCTGTVPMCHVYPRVVHGDGSCSSCHTLPHPSVKAFWLTLRNRSLVSFPLECLTGTVPMLHSPNAQKDDPFGAVLVRQRFLRVSTSKMTAPASTPPRIMYW